MKEVTRLQQYLQLIQEAETIKELNLILHLAELKIPEENEDDWYKISVVFFERLEALGLYETYIESLKRGDF